MRFPFLTSYQPYFAPDTGAATAADDTTDEASNSEGESDDSTPDEDAAPPEEPGVMDAAEQNWDINDLEEDSELNRAMNEVGGNLGRGEGDSGDEEEPPAGEEESADSDVEDSEETSEDEDSEDEDSEDEDSEESEDEGEADAEAEDAEGDETDEDEEGDAEEESEDEGEPLPEEVQEIAQEHIPDRVIETTDQLGETLEEYRETAEVFDVVDHLVEQDEHLEQYMELRLQEDMSPRAAAQRAMRDLVEAPDPDEDPEAYAEWEKQRALAERDQEEAEQQEEQISEAEENFRDQSGKSFQRLATQKDMSEDELERFKSRVNTMVFGDQNGNVPSDQADRLWFALNKDEVIEQVREEALEEGRRQGRNEQIDERDEAKRGDGLPKPDGSSEPDEPATDREKELATIGDSFEQAGADPDDFKW